MHAVLKICFFYIVLDNDSYLGSGKIWMKTLTLDTLLKLYDAVHEFLLKYKAPPSNTIFFINYDYKSFIKSITTIYKYYLGNRVEKSNKLSKESEYSVPPKLIPVSLRNTSDSYVDMGPTDINIIINRLIESAMAKLRVNTIR